MAKKRMKRSEITAQGQKKKKTAQSQIQAAEYVGYLSELNKLQGVLLSQLRKVV